MTWRPRGTRRMRGNKFGAVRTTIDGQTFDSKHEARRWMELQWRQKAGEIQDLRRQVPYEFVVDGRRVGGFKPDFEYVICATGEVITEDAKAGPTRTEAYQLRKKLMLACHHVTISEV